MGIYSGRIDETTEIGMVWKPNTLLEIIQNYYSNFKALNHIKKQKL